MPNSLDPSFTIPESFFINVSPYDEAENLLLRNLSQWDQINQHLSLGRIRIEKQTFLKYSLFRQRDILTPEKIARRLEARELMLSDLIQARGESIGINPECNVTNHRSETEDIGEALGLCIADAIFNTSDLDWVRIPESKNKTLDAYGSNEIVKIEWESKGSILHGDDLRPSTVSQHKRSIKSKKSALSSEISNSIRLGSIAILRADSTIPSNIFIVDPPVEYQERSPEQVRIINRLRNISTLISSLKPGSPFAAVLQSRLSAIISLTDFSPLDSVGLLNGLAEPFDVTPGTNNIHSRFFTVRSQVENENVGGGVIFINEKWLFFYGFRGELVELAANQQFQRILEYTGENISVDKNVICIFTIAKFEKITGKKVEKTNENLKSDGQYVSFSANGTLHYTKGGHVFGWLSRPFDI